MKKILTIILILLASFTFAQKKFYFNKSEAYTVKKICCDTFIVADTAYLMDKYAFNTYNNLYNDFTNSKILSKCLYGMKNIKNSYEKLLDVSYTEFDSLQVEYTKLHDESVKYSAQVKNDMLKINNHVATIDSTLSIMNSELKTAKSQQRKKLIEIGTGGVIIGILIGIIL